MLSNLSDFHSVSFILIQNYDYITEKVTLSIELLVTQNTDFALLEALIMDHLLFIQCNHIIEVQELHVVFREREMLTHLFSF